MTKHKHADLIHANKHRFEYIGGKLFWKDGVHKGNPAGWLDSSGYYQVNINGTCVLVHRIIWMLHNDSYPEQIDHINRNRTDNRIENLRASTNTKNQHNASMRRDNSTGYIGVMVHEGKYQARISVNGKRKHLGTFDNIEDAANAYQQAKEIHHAYTTQA